MYRHFNFHICLSRTATAYVKQILSESSIILEIIHNECDFFLLVQLSCVYFETRAHVLNLDLMITAIMIHTRVQNILYT